MESFTKIKTLEKVSNQSFFLKTALQSSLLLIISIAIFAFGYKIGYAEAFGFFISLGGLMVFLLGLALFIQAYLISKRDH